MGRDEDDNPDNIRRHPHRVLYEGNPTESSVRMWRLDLFTNHAPHHVLDPDTGALSKDFVYDLARAYSDGRM